MIQKSNHAVEDWAKLAKASKQEPLGRDEMEVLCKISLMEHKLNTDESLKDTLGVQGLHFGTEQGLDFWFKPLANGDWAFTILNPAKKDVEYAINWQRFNLYDDEVSKRSTTFDKQVYGIRDLWTHKMAGQTSTKNKVERK